MHACKQGGFCFGNVGYLSDRALHLGKIDKPTISSLREFNNFTIDCCDLNDPKVLAAHPLQWTSLRTPTPIPP